VLLRIQTHAAEGAGARHGVLLQPSQQAAGMHDMPARKLFASKHGVEANAAGVACQLLRRGIRKAMLQVVVEATVSDVAAHAVVDRS
jgi:hypothetical protein